MNRITLNSGVDYLDWREGSGNTVEIFDIVVRSGRREGRGRWMINDLLDNHLPEGTVLVWAITRVENIIAKQFYEEMRFRIVANLWNFYKDTLLRNTVDAVMYGRDIYKEDKK